MNLEEVRNRINIIREEWRKRRNTNIRVADTLDAIVDYVESAESGLIGSTSDLTNDGDGVSKFATEKQVFDTYKVLCAPAGFDPTAQTINIIEEFKNYANINKRFIYSTYDDTVGFRLENGDSYRIIYGDANNRQFIDVNHAQTAFPDTTVDFSGNTTELPVISTDGFPSSGIVFWADYNGGYQHFIYTSKTATKFIGASQNITYTKTAQSGIFLGVLKGSMTNVCIVVNRATTVQALMNNNKEAKWVYCGNNVELIEAGYNVGIGGICRIKWIHYSGELPKIGRYLSGNIGYAQFWNNSLEGNFYVPSSCKSISSGSAGAKCIASTLIDAIYISNGVSLLTGEILTKNGSSVYVSRKIAPESTLQTFVGATKLYKPANGTGYNVAPYTSFSNVSDLKYKGDFQEEYLLSDYSRVNAFNLSELEQDSNHRTLTDAQIASFEGKQAAGDYATNTALGNEVAARQSAVSNLQSQVDATNAAQNLVDIVATKSALNAYVTTNLQANDKIEVLVDETQEDANTIYSWSGTAWILIGSKAAYYSKSETDTLLLAKTDTETAEYISVNKILKTIESSWTQIQPTYQKISENAYLTGAAKTNLDASYTNADTKFNELYDKIEEVIANGKVTSTELSQVNVKYDAYIQAQLDFYEKLQLANNAILATLADGVESELAAKQPIGSYATTVDGKVPADQLPSALAVGAIETILSNSTSTAPASSVLYNKIVPVEENIAKIDTSLKEGDLNISSYATTQSITLIQGSTSPVRFQWNIPINKLVAGDKICLKLKSVNGANTGSLAWFKYDSTELEQVVWTSGGDGFFYSQLLEIIVSQGDIDTYDPFIVIMQAINPSGFTADTLTIYTQYVSKNAYMVVPTNLINTLEIPWRGYSAMTPVKVKKDGTGNSTSIQEAINSITDASVNNQYVIDIYDNYEETNPANLWKLSNPFEKIGGADIQEFVSMIITKDFVHLRGIGGRKKISVTMPKNLNFYNYGCIQALWRQGNCIVDNLDFTIDGGRYAAHQDLSAVVSQDINATTIHRNSKIKHLGNIGYPANTWGATMAEADGISDGQKLIWENVLFESDNPTPFYFHSNKDYQNRPEARFENCKILCKSNVNLNSMGVKYGDIGSGKKALITLIGCNFSKFTVDNSINSTEQTMTACDLWENGGAELLGYGNTPMLANLERPNVLHFETVNLNQNIMVTGGTAKDLICGDIADLYVGTTDAKGEVYYSKRLELPWLNAESGGGSQIFSLPYRLGNCASAPKTLIVNVAGVDYTITFNQNYMTANGSSYSWNTVPAISQSDILATINAAYPAIFQASIGSAIKKLQTVSDAMDVCNNFSSQVFLIGTKLVRDYDNGMSAWKKAVQGDIVEAIAAERINPGSSGAIIYAKKAIFVCWMLGLYPAVTGTLYKVNSNGDLEPTINRQEASFVAIDNENLIGI